MVATIVEFLHQKGSVELLCVLTEAESMRQFTELDNNLEISTSTLSKRLDEGQSVGLISVNLNYEEERGHVYRITPLGGDVARKMQRLGLIRTYMKLRGIDETFQEQIEELIEWAADVDKEIDDYLDPEMQFGNRDFPR